MTIVNEMHVGDIGTVIEVIVTDKTSGEIVNIESATTMQIIFKKPDETTVTKTAAHSTDGTDGKMFYTTIADDVDQDGHWKYQGYVVMPGGSWKSDVLKFYVFPNLS